MLRLFVGADTADPVHVTVVMAARQQLEVEQVIQDGVAGACADPQQSAVGMETGHLARPLLLVRERGAVGRKRMKRRFDKDV